MTELRLGPSGTVGFLHTAQVHVATFETLSQELLPSARTVHRVDPDALELARQDGTAESVRAVVAAHLAELRKAGCEVVLCTCSTLGEVAEELSGDGLRVIRIDRPMLRRAVTLGPRIGVVAAIASTVGPTTRVLAEEAADAGADVSLKVSVVDGAWDAFLSGDAELYHSRIAEAARALADCCDAVVLAQASMEPAATRLSGLATPVLTSPRAAVEAMAAGIPSLG
ncbi:aspartate/glutamate racemase family protein [Pseudarthrobacter sulfonivorans]|uniref:aspartate/glutamate racemase family protein n=1 Tax=Pseudarthrobacter sulfonivorans TaxID=121292 RepID=UPI00210264C7|nr:aspartate/glutamate racemase family protein [Pseudarthrobacter sulfonivorans]